MQHMIWYALDIGTVKRKPVSKYWKLEFNVQIYGAYTIIYNVAT